MKLVRYGNAGNERAGIIGSDQGLRDLSMLVPDISGAQLAPEVLDALRLLDVDRLPVVKGSPRYACPIKGVGKIICVGLNYAQHAMETGAKAPTEPVLFLKATNSITGPNDTVYIPRGSVKTDWEVELGVVIGQHTSYVSEAEAMSHVAGYVLINDVSEREFQLERGGQWDKGKGCDSFLPIGPWLVTRDEVADPQNLRLWLEVNGKKVQDSNTSDMIFGVAYLVSYISQFMSLQAGDIISTGTPQGVGLGQKPNPWYLKSGDTMRLGIDGLSEQTQTCKALT